MVTCQDIMDVMEEIAPRHLAEDWDNPGLLVGSPAARVERVFVCLDVSDVLPSEMIMAFCRFFSPIGPKIKANTIVARGVMHNS